MAFNWYKRELDKGLEGAIADSTISNIDSFAVEGTVGVNPGQPVIRGTAEKTVKVPVDDAGAAKIIGVAVHTHKEPSAPYYKQYDSVGIMTTGDIWVKTGAGVVEGDAAAVLGASGVYSFVKASTESAVAIAGGTYLDTAAAGELTRLRLRK